jgi:glutathione synthase/RimK-type ligase-like ATP-grasp enzyme
VDLVDQRRVLDTGLMIEAGPPARGCLRVGSREIDLTDIGAAYLRPHQSAQVVRARGHDAGSPEQLKAAAFDTALCAWADLTDAYVVNRPAASASNSSKPYQIARIAASGFLVPPTLVTNDPDQARAFVREHRDVVYKSVSAVRSRVRRLTPQDADRLPHVMTCPTQLQRRVRGTDVRVHVVGADVFAAEISCAADDYRYAVDQGCAPATLRAVDLPDDVATRCTSLATALQLPVAGIDLRRSPDGGWHCFEVNPSPAFTYYEAATGQPIAAAVAGLLAAAALCANRPTSASRRYEDGRS